MDFLPVREEGVRGFINLAKKGLHFEEDFFLSISSYTDDMLPSELPRAYLASATGDIKKWYGRYLSQHGLIEQVRTALDIEPVEITKEQLYRSLALHVPASDLLDLIGMDPISRLYLLRLITPEGGYAFSEEGGHVLFIVVNTERKEVALVHTTFR
jgi:hypothetical protein